MIVQAHVAIAHRIRRAWAAYWHAVDQILDQQAADDPKRRRETLPPRPQS